MMKMITAVVMVDGRCRFIKLHELSTDVEFWIWSATSFVGEGVGREALHMLGIRRVGFSEVGERGGGTAGWSLVVSLLIAFLEVEPQVGTFSFR